MSGSAKRTKEIAEYLTSKGYNCSVLTTYPRKCRSIPGYNAGSFDIINGVSVYRFKTQIIGKRIFLLNLTD